MGANLVWLCMPVHPRYIERGCDEAALDLSVGGAGWRKLSSTTTF
jgi:hypothetical protein